MGYPQKHQSRAIDFLGITRITLEIPSAHRPRLLRLRESAMKFLWAEKFEVHWDLRNIPGVYSGAVHN